MKTAPAASRQISSRAPHAFRRRLVPASLGLLLVALACTPALAQKLPSPDKVVADYVKAVGGKKRLAALRDATYEWSVRQKGRTSEDGSATTRLKSPASSRLDINIEQNEISFGATARSAWTLGRDMVIRTLTGAESKSARLQATLDAARLVDYKKFNLSAVTTGAEQVAGERAYVVEFRSRDAARVRYYFGATSKLLLQTVDDARRITARFTDYRAESGVLEPHRVELEIEGREPLVLDLQGAKYNAGLSDSLFDAPSKETLDVKALMRAVIEREPLTNVKYDEYTFTAKATERELNDKGETTKETVRVWDIFLAPNGRGIGKLVSVNNAPLPAERAAKEEKRVADFLTANEKATPPPAQKGEGGFHIQLGSYGFGLADILRASEFVAPRRERFQERDAIVFDYRPRADFKPKNKTDEILAQLVGLIWIDPVDKVIMRIEARSTDDFKIGGGMMLSIKPGAGFVFERMRLADGFWVPRLYQWNANGKAMLFMKKSVYETTEWSNYKRFKAEAGDAT
ncbi:MAG TPA: hypothetical protein VJT82_00495, partial [Pyrinomonadaceae bacterium]|nr:hypothetical protein [Pyrinomonadaceae bacterium]